MRWRPMRPPRCPDSWSPAVEEIQPGRCLASRWAHIPAILVISTPTAPIVELYVGSEYGRYAWRTLLELGERLGGTPVGWQALEVSGWK